MSTATAARDIADLTQRFLNLYTGAIADTLKNGWRNQVLPYYITPFTKTDRIAGPAFTAQGFPCADITHNDTEVRLKVLDQATPGCVTVLATGGSMECSHWGEIMSTVVKQRGSTGAVVDGGVSDLDFINAMNYPVFGKFKSAASCVGRWDMQDCQIPIKIGNTVIHPGDFVFGDVDGVVIVPKDITLDVLTAAEDVLRRESGMRADLRRGVPVKEAFEKYGTI